MTGPKKNPRATATRVPRGRSMKAFLLPMPRAQADAMSLQCRLALEAVRQGRSERREATCMAQTVLLTGFLAEAGHGLIGLPEIRSVEQKVLEMLDRGEATGDWLFPEALVNSLVTVVNEHDRQLRETRFEVILNATERLERMIASAPEKLASGRVA
jgi:hypothetical protein